MASHDLHRDATASLQRSLPSALKSQTFTDGIFHGVMWLVLLVGLGLLTAASIAERNSAADACGDHFSSVGASLMVSKASLIITFFRFITCGLDLTDRHGLQISRRECRSCRDRLAARPQPPRRRATLGRHSWVNAVRRHERHLRRGDVWQRVSAAGDADGGGPFRLRRNGERNAWKLDAIHA